MKISIDLCYNFCHSKRVFICYRLVVIGDNIIDEIYEENYLSTKLTLVIRPTQKHLSAELCDSPIRIKYSDNSEINIKYSTFSLNLVLTNMTKHLLWHCFFFLCMVHRIWFDHSRWLTQACTLCTHTMFTVRDLSMSHYQTNMLLSQFEWCSVAI